MSYILDALRKADAERERGAVPGIHAQPMFPPPSSGGAARRARRWPWIAAGALIVLLLLGLALAWALRGNAPARNEATPVAQVAAPPAVVAPAATTGPVPPTAAPATVVAAAEPAPATAPATPPTGAHEPAAAARDGEAPAPAHKTKVKPAPPKAQLAKVPPLPAADPNAPPMPASLANPPPMPASIANPPPMPASLATGPAAAPGASSPALFGKIYALSELPDDIRRQLPSVSVGGSMYSSVKANRILIVNGQVLHEGEKLNADTALEQIRVRSAVLAFKGYRYTLAF